MKPEIRVTLRKPEVMRALGYSSTQLDDLVARKILPAPFKLSPGGRAVGWDGDVIAKFQEQQRQETVTYKTPPPRKVNQPEARKAAKR